MLFPSLLSNSATLHLVKRLKKSIDSHTESGLSTVPAQFCLSFVGRLLINNLFKTVNRFHVLTRSIPGITPSRTGEHDRLRRRPRCGGALISLIPEFAIS